MDATGIRLTGGIGSGKSTAAGMLAARGAVVISADAAGHQVLEPGGAAVTAVADRWPQAVRDGRVDRSVLAEVVFEDAAALADLEAITHPLIADLLAERMAAASGPLIVLEIPVLRDGVGPAWPVVVVDAPDDVRRRRLEGRGMDPADVGRRMALQPSREEWLAVADYVVDNGGDLNTLAAECDRLWSVLGLG